MLLNMLTVIVYSHLIPWLFGWMDLSEFIYALVRKVAVYEGKYCFHAKGVCAVTRQVSVSTTTTH